MADFTKEEVLALANEIDALNPWSDNAWPELCEKGANVLRAYAEAMSAVPVGYTQDLRWRGEPKDQSEMVIKLTRSPQPKYGFTEPLYAAPPVSAPAEPVAVKALEWSNERKHGLSMRIGRGLGFAYEVCVKAYSPGWIATFGGLTVIYDGDDEDAAVAACQADYEARIRSALVSPPASEIGEDR